jgi:hypothetical protein
MGVSWNEQTKQQLEALEGVLDITAAGDAIREA